jgi:hypothetical protein
MDEMIVRLLRDHYEHKDGTVIHHLAGTTVELPNPIAEYINRSIIESRQITRELAAKQFGTPEHDR